MDTTAFIIAIIAAVFGSTGFWSWLQNRNRKKSAETRLLMGVGYYIIRTLGNDYLENRHVTIDEFHELEHYLYQPYTEMGGNGSAKKIFDDVSKLPIKSE